MDIHFQCTECGRCCRDTKIPLTVAEAIAWLRRGHDVQLLCEASPWPDALDHDPNAAHFKRRSFPVMSGSMPARVVVILAANAVGACPNLLPDQRCGIYETRPLVCRIYPAEINPFIRLRQENKACPPEAWTPDRPVLQHDGVLVDAVIANDIESSRAADARDAEVKGRACVAMNSMDTALVHEAMLAYSPSAATLLAALSGAVATDAPQGPPPPWRFVSDRTETVALLSTRGADAFQLDRAATAAYQHFDATRAPIFSA
jgi:Fe-S-cluster containining protein